MAYRETITQAVTIDYTHKKQTGGSGQFAASRSSSNRCQPGSGFVFENEDRRRLGAEGISSRASKRASRRRRNGVLAGFPMIDFKATLIDGAYHEVDFERAGIRNRGPRRLPRRLRERRGPKLLEPIMKVEVVTPED